MGTFTEVLALARGRVRAFAMVAVLVSLGTGAALLEPIIYRAMIDDIAGVFAASRTSRDAAATVIIGALLVVAIRLLAEWFKRLGDNRAAYLANDIERDLIVRTFRHVVRLPLSFFTTRASGAIARQIDQSDNVAPIFTAIAQDLWPDLFRLTVILGIMVAVNVELAAVAAVTILVYSVITWRLARTLGTESDQYYALWDEVSTRIQQAIAGIKTVQAHGMEDHESSRVEAASHDAYASYLRRRRVRNRYSYMQDAVITVSKASVLAFGGLKALHHQLTPGDVVMFLAYLDRLYNPIEGLTGMYSDLQKNVAGMRRAQRLLAEPTASEEGRLPLSPGKGAVRFENVSFEYVPHQEVLKGVSFELRAGERTALVGPSGAGKTTVADLLAGLYGPTAGRVLVDGQPVDQLLPSSVRSAVRSVASDGALFRMSIADNIRYGRLTGTDHEVGEAARLAGLEPLLARLPDGLETVIGERGVALSVGECQRILLARAFVARPTVLILDEATANLDFRTEAAVKRGLDVLSRGRTTLLMAHRPSMLTDVDRVIVLQGGRIEQDGAPEDLLRRSGYFRDMMTAPADATFA